MSSFNTPWLTSRNHIPFDRLKSTDGKHIVITGSTNRLAEEVLQKWKVAGFRVQYVPCDGDESRFAERLRQLGEEFDLGDDFAIVAFGNAASIVLQTYSRPSSPRPLAVIAYYPTTIPVSPADYPSSLKVLVHYAGSDNDIRSRRHMLATQSRKVKAAHRRVDSGAGIGDYSHVGFRAYTYRDCNIGFAEHDLDEYDAIAERLAFSRSLAVVQKAFRVEEDLEAIRDDVVEASFSEEHKDLAKRVEKSAVMINVPSLTGGVGWEAIEDYFGSSFHPLPPAFDYKLISRTIGADRIVDEILIHFTHSVPMHWILPDIPSTNKDVEIILVSISSFRAGRLLSEHIYWDQASVLMQVGLLNAEKVPDHWRKRGVKRLPVVGQEGARAVAQSEINSLHDLASQ